MMPCWKITVTKEAREALKTKTPGQRTRYYLDDNGNMVWKNVDMRLIVQQLEIRYGQSNSFDLYEHPEQEPPFIDETEMKGTIDYVIPESFVKAENDAAGNNFHFSDYVAMLKTIGLELKKETKNMFVVVIKDSVK